MQLAGTAILILRLRKISGSALLRWDDRDPLLRIATCGRSPRRDESANPSLTSSVRGENAGLRRGQRSLGSDQMIGSLQRRYSFALA